MNDDRPAPSPEEVAAILAAVEVVLGHRAPEPPQTPAWRWSGRQWQRPEDQAGWRRPGG
ncbi:MAG TPA: hypothetical protein VHH09_06935 [Acidimicrobiales bacterium]|nr:hypothetical protein [Acidimicrobiales bacterium]